ncbi:hypothetical protein F5X96DRAFT_589777 [Biscogniauxia mediterranea]|nr:hypothetical protein F5X96DRAFT_589777 [Biscogniauxia mediterranea]
MDRQLMRLPLELIFQVMTSLLPGNPYAVIPAPHPATQLLVAFSLVSRATHEIAVRELRRHCLYLDSDRRLSRFLLCLEASRQSRTQLPSVFQDITSLYLAPFGRSLDNLPTAEWTRELFCYTRESLRRLIVDIPFDSLPPWDDHLNVGPVLREGFAQLTKLEEFVCTRDAVRFDMGDDPSEQLQPVLQQWPRLRRLGLYRPMCSERFWGCLANLPNLEHAVLTTPLAITSTSVDVGSFPTWRAERPITVVLAQNTSEALLRTSLAFSAFPAGLADENRKMKQMMRIMTYRIPRLEGSGTGVELGSSWLMRTALDGELWGVRGYPLTGPLS